MDVRLKDALPHWTRLREQWREQPRLRLAGWLVLALLAAHLLLLGSDWRDARRQAFEESARRLAQMRALASQGDWPDRAVQAEDVRSALRKRLWQARNPSLARADVQAWLDAQARQSGLQDARISVLPPLDFDKEDVGARVQAQLRGRFEPKSFGRLLHALESAEHWVSIVALELNDRGSPSVNLQLTFHFRPDGTPP
ncbi:hypothetical protein DK254_07605 [Pseudomonas sp. RW407]|nr:hypothetical protein DK254_07605 [Pseudomonas sp. RW407]